MMYWFQCTVIFILIEGFTNAVKLPSYFNKCSLSDPNLGDCVTESANSALPMLLNGDRSIHVMNMKPLYVPYMFLDIGGHLQINITEANIHGLETMHITDVKWDRVNNRLDSNLYLDYSHLIGQYDINGRILILPITGQGPCNITYFHPKFKYFFEFEPIENIGTNKDHVKIINSGMTYELERAYFKLENLFNGDKRLGEEMLKFMDENWREINQEIGARVGDALAEIFTSIIKQIFARVPLNELFLE